MKRGDASHFVQVLIRSPANLFAHFQILQFWSKRMIMDKCSYMPFHLWSLSSSAYSLMKLSLNERKENKMKWSNRYRRYLVALEAEILRGIEKKMERERVNCLYIFCDFIHPKSKYIGGALLYSFLPFSSIFFSLFLRL